jgi:hypothetical protein
MLLVLSSLCFADTNQTDLEAIAMVALKMEDNSILDDSSPNDNDGVWIGGTPDIVTGKMGDALDFERDDSDWGSIPYDGSFDSIDVSVSYWVKVENPGSNMNIVNRGINDWNSQAEDKYYMFYNDGNNNVQSTTPPQTDYVHVVICLSDGDQQLFVNNIQEDTETVSVDNTNNLNLSIGGFTGNSNYLDGILDEVYIFNGSICDGSGKIEWLWNDGEGNEIFPASDSVNVDFISQDPSNIKYDTFSLINISYNITSDSNLNISSIKLNYKTNTTTQDYSILLNGSIYKQGFNVKDYDINSSSLFSFYTDETKVLPAVYNIDQSLMENTSHQSGTLGFNDFIKLELLNVSSELRTNFLEIMLNATGFLSSDVIYCNSSYTIGNPDTSQYCTEIAEIGANDPFNNSNSQFSKHHLIDFPIDANGQINGIGVSSTSYFLFEGNIFTTWYYWYISDSLRDSNSQISTDNGDSWNNIAGTLDGHLHQYSLCDTTTYYYNAEACSINGVCTTSTIQSDIIETDPDAPSAPDIYQPNRTSYNADVDINYSASTAGEGRSIVYYNITLLDDNENFVKIIKSNNSLNLGYTWDSTTTPEGDYIIKVEACDNASSCGFDLSDIITLDRTNPVYASSIPDEDGTSQIENRGMTLFQGNASDNNDLYLLEINITQGGTNVYSFGLYNLSGTTNYVFSELINTTSFANTAHNFNVRVCDAHTDKDIPDISNIIRDEKLSFLYKKTSLDIISENSLKKTVMTKEKDRYSISYAYDDLSTEKSFMIKAKNIRYLKNSRYKAHFVIDNIMWLDFENDKDAPADVVKIDNNTYRVIIYTTANDIRFNSVGFLNCLEENYNFNLIPYAGASNPYNMGIISDTNWFNSDALDHTTTPGMLAYFFIFLVIVSLVVLGESIQMPAVVAFTGIISFFFSMYIFVNMSVILGSLLCIISMMYAASSTRYM